MKNESFLGIQPTLGSFSTTSATFVGHFWSKIAIFSKKKLPKMDLVHINQNQLVLFIRLFFHSILIGFVVWFLRCLGGKISFLSVTWVMSHDLSTIMSPTEICHQFSRKNCGRIPTMVSWQQRTHCQTRIRFESKNVERFI